jgi:hypothetical protein
MDHRDEAIDGLGEREGRVWLGRRIVGETKGDGAEAANQGAEENAGVAIGDGAGAVLKESAEDEEDGGTDLGGIEGGQGAAEVEPAAEWGSAVAEGGDAGLRGVPAAEDVAGGGAAAAVLAVGIEEAALHGTLLEKAGSRQPEADIRGIPHLPTEGRYGAPGARHRRLGKGKGRLCGGLFYFLPSIIRIPGSGSKCAKYFAISGTISGVL